MTSLTEEQKRKIARLKLKRIAISLWSKMNKYTLNDFENALRKYEGLWRTEVAKAERGAVKRGIDNYQICLECKGTGILNEFDSDGDRCFNDCKKCKTKGIVYKLRPTGGEEVKLTES